MLRQLVESIRRAWARCKPYPITALLILTATGLHIAVMVSELQSAGAGRDGLRSLGAVSQLAIFQRPEAEAFRKQIPQLTGPFDLWDGEWWRIIVSGFHHGGPLHLLLNSLAIAYMGMLLEPKFRRIAYFLFFMAATTFSVVPEFLMEHIVVGLSGAAYAMFGVLLVLRKHDRYIADRFPQSMVYWGVAWLFLCIALTVLDILPIANVAHFCGLFYGWVIGVMAFGERRFRNLARAGFVVLNLAILPGIYFTVHPVWTGRYHWYQATMTHTGDPDAQRADLEKTVALDPGLATAWAHLAEIEFDTSGRQQAWRTAMNGLFFNRSSEEVLGLCRRIWLSFDNAATRQQARETTADVFGEHAVAWQERLGILPGQTPPPASVAVNPLGPNAGNALDPRQRLFDLNSVFGEPNGDGEEQRRHPLQAPQVDPDHPDSAAVGART